MPIYKANGSQLRPCIVSKVRHALGLKSASPTNKERCSQGYWDEVCEIVGKEANLYTTIIERAKSKRLQYMWT